MWYETYLKEMADRKVPSEGRVPLWFYDQFTFRGRTFCGFTNAAALWWSNVCAMCLHIVLAVVTAIVSTRDGRSFNTPILTVYLTDLTWVRNQTNALIPRYQATEGLYLSHMVLWFFLLSALAHGTVVLFNGKQAWGCDDPKCRRLGHGVLGLSTGWYFIWIHQCRNPLRYVPQLLERAHCTCLLTACVPVPLVRWVEYSFSASLMGMVFAVTGGINHLYMVCVLTAFYLPYFARLIACAALRLSFFLNPRRKMSRSVSVEHASSCDWRRRCAAARMLARAESVLSTVFITMRWASRFFWICIEFRSRGNEVFFLAWAFAWWNVCKPLQCWIHHPFQGGRKIHPLTNILSLQRLPLLCRVLTRRF